MDQNNIPIFNSLTKVMCWCGIPRNMFIFLVLTGIILAAFLHSIHALIPIMAIYFIILALFRIDHQIFGILCRNLALKSHYFPD